MISTNDFVLRSELRADQGDFECKIKNRVPVSLPCVPDRDGNSANRKVIVLSFIASLL